MKTIAATDIRKDFAETLADVSYRDARVSITKHGKPVAALIPAADLELLELLEDRADLELVRKRLAESDGTLSLEEVLEDLEL